MGDGMTDGSYCSRCNEERRLCTCAAMARRKAEEAREAKRGRVVAASLRFAEARRALNDAEESLEPLRHDMKVAQEELDRLLEGMDEA